MWKELMHEYLRTSYKNGESMCDIESGGVIYKVMKKDDKVTFYDDAGNTLFNVSYGQLDKEYAVLSVKGQAKKKLEKELKKAKDKSFAEPVIEYLIKHCGEDEGLSQDVIQEHKTWEKCYGFIYSQAQKSAQKGVESCAVRGDIVYEWAEDYYHRDDKAEEEKKAKEAAERRKKEEDRRKKAGGQKKADRKNLKQDVKKDGQAGEKPVEQPKPKKNPKEMEGQLDMFSMMGM